MADPHESIDRIVPVLPEKENRKKRTTKSNIKFEINVRIDPIEIPC